MDVELHLDKETQEIVIYALTRRAGEIERDLSSWSDDLPREIATKMKRQIAVLHSLVASIEADALGLIESSG